jgi:hypothetical protein
VSFTATILCVASQRVIPNVCVYFVTTQSGNFWIHRRTFRTNPWQVSQCSLILAFCVCSVYFTLWAVSGLRIAVVLKLKYRYKVRIVNTVVRGCIQKFPGWPSGARTANGTALCH